MVSMHYSTKGMLGYSGHNKDNAKFFCSSFILKDLNSTFIILIPKKKGANSFNDFKPISLSNVTWKIISKIIAN